MPRQFFSGNSIEQAVMAAARHYKLEPERLAYKLRDKKHGFLNIRRRVVIEVDPENLEVVEPEPETPETESPVVAEQDPIESESSDADDHAGESDHAVDGEEDSGDSSTEDSDDESDDDESPVDDDSDDDDSDEDDEPKKRDRSDGSQGGRSRGGRGGRGRGRQSGGKKKRPRRRDVEVEEFFWNDDEDGWDSEDVEPGESQALTAVELCVERILDVMDLEIEYTITEGDAIEIEFSGEDAEFLTEDNGKVLKAIEQIVPRMVRGLIGHSITVNADCDGFRADHESSLQELAEQAAEDVVQRGKPKTLSPMNPADRRIVHLTLVDHPDVETISQGHGFMKRVKILPAGD